MRKLSPYKSCDASSLIADKPLSDVYVSSMFMPQTYQLNDVLCMHREFSQPEMLNSPDSLVQITLWLSGQGRKQVSTSSSQQAILTFLTLKKEPKYGSLEGNHSTALPVPEAWFEQSCFSHPGWRGSCRILQNWRQSCWRWFPDEIGNSGGDEHIFFSPKLSLRLTLFKSANVDHAPG